MTIAIRAKRLWDGTGADPIDEAVILVEGDRIAEVGRAAQVAIPRGAELIDRGDETLLPGLIDAHSHCNIVPGLGNQLAQLAEEPARSYLRAIPNLRVDLLSGVTTMRVVGEEHFMDIELREGIRRGQIPGPRLLVATRPIVARSGHGATITFSDGVDEVRRNVRENIRRGADLIKLFITGGVSSEGADPYACTYSAEEIQVAIAEAHRFGRLVAAHCHGGPGVRIAVDAGIDSLEHGALMTPEDFEYMKQGGTWLVANNAILFHPEGIEKGDGHVPKIMAKLHQGREAAARTFRTMLESGVRWALGTDSMHGLLWYEAAKAVEFGATPVQALQAITSRAADVCGILDKTGTLTRGKWADLIAVAGDPLGDVTVLENPKFVVQGGVRLDFISRF